MTNNLFILTLVTAILITACNNKVEKKDFIARVNDSYLYKNDLTTAAKNNAAVKSEQVRNWITTEVLYLEGLSKNIGEEEEYKELLEKTKKELVKTIWLKKFLENERINYSIKDLENYFEQNKNTFKVGADAYLINLMSFIDESKAIKFRNAVFESEWTKIAKSFINDVSKLEERNSELVYSYKIFNGSLLRILNEMEDKEISIVIKQSDNKFTVIQLIKKFKKDDLPDFSIIKNDVERRFLDVKKKELLEKHIKDLFSKYDIEIKE